MKAILTGVLALSFSGLGMVLGQHDHHRNAMREIAAGDFEKAASILGRADAQDPETAFVRSVLSAASGNDDRAVAEARRAVTLGLPVSRLQAGPRNWMAPVRASPWFKGIVDEEGRRLLHGPMVGQVTPDGVAFWMRTDGPAEVGIVIDREGSSMESTVTTREASDFTAVIRFEGLQPATRYDYRVKLDGETVPGSEATFRTAPEEGASGSFRVVFGGCAGYGPEFEFMWDTIRGRKPDALFLLGDNVYIDDPEHETTQNYCYYRRQERPEWRRLVRGVPVYAIYDDHDFGMNDCIPGPLIDEPAWKRPAWEVFRRNWVNPSYGGGDQQPGCWFDFYLGDVHFIFLDGRYYRDLKGKTMLGPVQKAWLKETLAGSKGTFKVLASPVPWSEGVKPGSRDPWDGFPEEREEIFGFLEAKRIDGVILIAADRHRTDLRVTRRENGYDLYEFESGRLTNHHRHRVIETPGLIWGYDEGCAFGLIEFETAEERPHVRFEAVDIDGKTLHEYELPLSRLSHGS